MRKVVIMMKMNDIEKVTFELENFAYIEFKIEDFIKMNFSGIKYTGDDEYLSDKVNIVIRKAANKKSKYKLTDDFELEEDLFDKIINIPNIDYIVFQTKKKSISIFPICNQISHGINTFQVGKIDKNGNLAISIKERKLKYE